jgi:hypothetical protein
VVSKPQIRFKGKRQADRESAAYIGYVSIYRRPATQPLGLLSSLANLSIRREIPLYLAGRWDFENTSSPFGKVREQGLCQTLIPETEII